MLNPKMAVIERNDTLAEKVRESLRKSLIEGVFVPGERIKIRNVAQALGVSPTPAREALMHLIAEGALLADTNKTAIVPPLTQESLREITELRLALETSAAVAAVPNLKPSDIDEIERIDLAGINALRTGDMRRVTELNATFHFSIYAHAQMPLMLRMIETTWLRSGAYLAIGYEAFVESRKGFAKHDAILDALRKRDRRAVKARIEDDIRATSAILSKTLQHHLSERQRDDELDTAEPA